MPKEYHGEPELSKREKKFKDAAEEIAKAKAEKPWHPRQLKGPFLPKKKPPAKKQTFKYRPMA